MIKLIERCFAHYTGQMWDDDGALTPADPPVGCGGVGVACTDPVFALDTVDSKDEQEPIVDIQAVARFAYVPQMVPGTTVNGNSTVRIGGFRAIYLQRVYGGNCNTSGCPITWDPGVGYSSTVSTNKASAITAFVFPPGILPNGLSDPDALDRYGVNRFIQLTR